MLISVRASAPSSSVRVARSAGAILLILAGAVMAGPGAKDPPQAPDLARVASAIEMPCTGDQLTKSVRWERLENAAAVAELMRSLYTRTATRMAEAQATFLAEEVAARSNEPPSGRDTGPLWSRVEDARAEVLRPFWSEVEAIVSAVVPDGQVGAVMDRIRGRAALHDWERRLGRFQAIMRPPPDLRSLLGRIRLASSPGARDAIVVATSSTDPPSSEFDALVQATLSQYEGMVGRQVSELARRAGVERGAVEPASRARARASRLQLEWSMVKSGQRAIEEIASLVQATWGADAAAEMEVRLHALIWPRLFDVDRPVRVVDPLARPPVWEDCLAGPARTGLVRLHRDILAQVSLHLKAGEFPLPPHDADMDGSHDRFQLRALALERLFHERFIQPKAGGAPHAE